MSKSEGKADVKNPVDEIAAESLTLDEFCARLSKTDKRVELIGGFFADAKKRGHNKDVDVGFLRAFAEYADRPVN
jgi:hypothetical protein